MTLGDDVVFATLNYQRKLNPMAVDGPHPVRNCGVAFMALARNCGVALGACGAVLSATARPRVAAVHIAVAHWLAAPSAFTAWAHHKFVLPLAPFPCPCPLFLLLPKMPPRQTLPLLWGGNPGSGKGIVV